MNKSFLYYLLAFAVIYGIFRGVKYFYLKPSGTTGAIAQDFSATLKSGESFKLSDLKGNYVLLQFWGSWCGPCRRENKELKEVYPVLNKAKFKNAKGFEIVSVGIETDPNRWESAILQDQMGWKYHMSDFNSFDSEIAKQYGIKSIPASYLIDPGGKILGINWSVNKIHSFLSQEINNN